MPRNLSGGEKEDMSDPIIEEFRERFEKVWNDAETIGSLFHRVRDLVEFLLAEAEERGRQSMDALVAKEHDEGFKEGKEVDK